MFAKPGSFLATLCKTIDSGRTLHISESEGGGRPSASWMGTRSTSAGCVKGPGEQRPFHGHWFEEHPTNLDELVFPQLYELSSNMTSGKPHNQGQFEHLGQNLLRPPVAHCEPPEKSIKNGLVLGKSKLQNLQLALG